MSYDKCKTCGRYDWTDSRHTCPPRWKCWEDDEEDYRMVHARDSQEAAEEYAEALDQDGGDGVEDGQERKLRVRDGESIKAFTVTASYRLDYHATEEA